VKSFIEKLKHVDLRDKKAFAFDTKFGSRFAGSAGKEIEKRLKKHVLNIVRKHASAIVKGGQGPLQDSMVEKLIRIGTELAK
jgi:hypothetical protein